MKLIQECSFKTLNPEEVSGIDSLLSYEYMGSSEYEWGAKGKSLLRILPIRNKYVLHKTAYSAKAGGCLMLLSHKKEHLLSLEKIIRVPYSVRDVSTLSHKLKGEKGRRDSVQVWWDLEEDWFAFLGEKRASLFTIALDKTAIKKSIK